VLNNALDPSSVMPEGSSARRVKCVVQHSNTVYEQIKVTLVSYNWFAGLYDDLFLLLVRFVDTMIRISGQIAYSAVTVVVKRL
jgi:hypothetical protein